MILSDDNDSGSHHLWATSTWMSSTAPPAGARALWLVLHQCEVSLGAAVHAGNGNVLAECRKRVTGIDDTVLACPDEVSTGISGAFILATTFWPWSELPYGSGARGDYAQ